MKMLALIFALIVLGLVGGHNRVGSSPSKPKIVCQESKPVPPVVFSAKRSVAVGQAGLGSAIVCETR